MKVFDPTQLPTKEIYQLMIGAIAPRPIALVSTFSLDNIPNLAPYSYFNAFSSHPPLVAFSSNLKTDSAKKDTLINLVNGGELVINMVDYKMVRQMAITSITFPHEVDEFEKSGLTPLTSQMVRPYRVAESPIQMECKVDQIIPLGDQMGSGNLILCKVLLIHVNEKVMDANGRINPHKADLMGRLGRAYYIRTSGEGVHTIYQPSRKVSIGFDKLPASAKQSKILTGNDLGQLAGIYELPTPAAIQALSEREDIAALLTQAEPMEALHRLAQKELRKEKREDAAELVWLAASIVQN